MTNVERIHAGQEGLDRLQSGIETMQVALEKAEQAAVVAEETSHVLRKVVIVVALLGLIGIAVAVMRSKRSGSDEPATTDTA